MGTSTAPPTKIFNRTMPGKAKAPAQLIEVRVEQVPAPASKERLRRAYELILRAAARIEEKLG